MSRSNQLLALLMMSVISLSLTDVAAQRQERQFGGVGLTVFAEPDFRGESATFREDVPNLQSMGLNDRISSLRVARGEVWEVCEHANYGGRCQVISGAESDLRENRWNDIISSARRVRDNGRDNGRGRGRGLGRGGPSGGGVELFADVGFQGERRRFNNEMENLQSVDFNDKARSLRVEGNGSWQICVDANFQNCMIIDRDISDLGRMGVTRKISSLRPWREQR